MPGWDDTFWLTKQMRVDRDAAIYGEVTFDATDKLSFTGGARYFRTENSLGGFYGFGLNNVYGSDTGEQSCNPDYGVFETAPCDNLEKVVKQDDTTFRFNSTFHATDDVMFYATWSEGFRPGGVNRRGTFPPYKPDFLTNYEIGWKTEWANNRLRFNGAIFKGDWDNFQFSFLGDNGLTNVTNAPGTAKLEGVEMDIQWVVTDALSIYGGLAVQKAELGQLFCKVIDPATGEPYDTEDECIENGGQESFAPKGTRLPTTPEFKASLTGRYEFAMGGLDAHLQGSVVHNGDSVTALLPTENEVLGNSDAYTLVDLSFGIGRDKWGAELFVDNAFDEVARLYRYAECDASICGGIVYGVTTRPRMIGLRFNQKF